MEQTVMRSLGQSEPQGSRNVTSNEVSVLNSAKIGSNKCSMFKDWDNKCRMSNALENKCSDGFAAERVQRQEDFASMWKEMKDEMGEGFKNERMAREQAQKEMRSEMRSEMRQ